MRLLKPRQSEKALKEDPRADQMCLSEDTRYDHEK